MIRALPHLCKMFAVLFLISSFGCDRNPGTAADSETAAFFGIVDSGLEGIKAGDPIPERYIVVLAEGELDEDGEEIRPEKFASKNSLRAGRFFHHAISGFVAQLTPQAARALGRKRGVVAVEPDTKVSLFPTIQGSSVQTNVTWGLDRIDQRSLPLDFSYNYNFSGRNVSAFVIDTGILYGHNDLGGRAFFGYDVFGGNGSDCNGHGTHVSGTIGGTIYGVAKDVRLVAVRVLDCSGSGSVSGVIAGIDWVAANHSGPSVANLSLGGGASTALDTAIKNLIASGVVTVVAAGNSSADACNTSPARVAEAITIGAADKTDTKASFSNYGSCVDWFAPGVSITSAWNSGNTAINTISGTSMAAPHTAGVAALYLEDLPFASPQTVRDALYAASTKGIVLSARSLNNHLLYSLDDSSVGGDVTPPTNVAVISPANGAKVNRGTLVTLTASAQDDVGVSRVDLFINNKFQCSATLASGETYQCNWVVPSKPKVTYSIAAKAYDAAGNSSTSPSISVVSQ